MKEGSLYIQKEKTGSVVYNTIDQWNVGITAIPFSVGQETKDVKVRDWKDEHGEDAYVPPGGLYLSAYDLKVSFCYKGDLKSAFGKITAFRDYLTGKDGSGAFMRIYDPHSGIGRKDVRLLKFDNGDLFTLNKEDVLEWDTTFRIGDPVTDIVLTDA